MKIGLRGPYNVFSGYGNDLIGLAKALDSAGIDVVPIPTSVTPGMPRQITDLFTKSPRGKYDVMLQHVPPFDMKVPDTIRLKADKVVGWTMWEQSEFHKGHQRGHRQGQRPWRNIDLMLAYDPVSMQALDFYDKRVPKKLLQGGVDTSLWPYVERNWSGTFRFAMLGELHMRKDPFVAIEAFRELRDEGELKDAELHLKTSVPGLHPAIMDLIPGLFVYCDMWSVQKVREFIESTHVLLAPSKGEGKNLPALETQLSGGVAVCTAWGGPQMWQHPDYSPPLKYSLVPVGPGETSVHAAADKEHLKEIMLDLYENREKTKRMGEIASENIRQMCDWSTVVKNLLRYIEEMPDGNR